MSIGELKSVPLSPNDYYNPDKSLMQVLIQPGNKNCWKLYEDTSLDSKVCTQVEVILLSIALRVHFQSMTTFASICLIITESN